MEVLKQLCTCKLPSETKQTLVYVDGVETSATVGQQDGRTLITFSSSR